MLIYETNLANIDPAKATKVTLGNKVPFFRSSVLIVQFGYLFFEDDYHLEIHRQNICLIKEKTLFMITAERPF